jgi:hypothetical protein
MRSSPIATTALCALLVAGCGTKPAPGEEPAAVAASCPASGMALWLREPTAGPNSGLRSMNVEVYNCGDRDRVLKGYPRVRLLNTDLKPLKVRIEHGSPGVGNIVGFDRPATTVTLKPGEVAATEILWREKPRSKRVVSPSVLEITPRPGLPAERLPDAAIDLAASRVLGIAPWVKVREANGVEVGDNAPHFGDNHAFQQRLTLTPNARLAATTAAGKIRTALEGLRVTRTLTTDSAMTALRALGFKDSTWTHPAGPGAIGYEVYPGQGACIYGTAGPDRVTATVDGVRLEGGCADR